MTRALGGPSHCRTRIANPVTVMPLSCFMCDTAEAISAPTVSDETGVLRTC